MKFLGFFLLLFLGFVSCSKSESMEQLEKHSKSEDIVIIDVRTKREFDAGHVKGAINIPFNEIKNRISEVTNQKDKPIAVYCRSGSRSGVAKGTLKSEGFTNVLNYGSLGKAKKLLE